MASCTSPEGKSGSGSKEPGGPSDTPSDTPTDVINKGDTTDPKGGEADAGSGEVDKSGSTKSANKARVISVAPSYALTTEKYQYRPKSNVAEETTWTIEKGPVGAKVASDGTIEWTPDAEQKGRHELKIVGKAGEHTVEQTGEITVGLTDERASVEVSEKEGGSAVVTAPNSKVRGASVTVRPATLKSASRLVIAETDVAPDMPFAKTAPHAVHFGPSGTVFSEPAMISLPLSGDESIDKNRVGAFVYNPQGKWERVHVVSVDAEQGLVHAKAKHFSMYAAAQSKLGMTVKAAAAASSGECAGNTLVDAWLDEPATLVDPRDVVGLPATLLARVDGAADGLGALLALEGVTGSLRFVRVVELGLGVGDQRVIVDGKLLVSTLVLKGDGSAKVVHSDALGNVQSSFDFASSKQSLTQIWAHLSGHATRALFKQQLTGAVTASARLHVRFDEGDSSLDAVSADDLGFALADAELALEAGLSVESGDVDVDCDGLLKAYDSLDNRLLASITANPPGVSSTTVGVAVELAAALAHAKQNTALSWRVIAGNGALSAVAGKPEARLFTPRAVGRFQVEVSGEVDGVMLSHVFAIDAAAAPVVLPSCMPSPVTATAKQNDALSLSAVLSQSTLPASAVGIEWGLLVNGAFTSSSELVGRGFEARLVPLYASRYDVACRVKVGTELGAQRSVAIDVVAPEQNLAPVDLVLSPASAKLQPGQTLVMAASGRDPEGAALRFTWSSAGATLGAPSNTNSASRVSFSASNPGLYEVRVTVRDQSENPQELRAFVLVAADTSGNDVDKDGWPASLDCNDNDAKVHPGAIDRCGDAVDDDCSGDARQSDCDNDGFTVEQGDCYDSSRDIRPGAFELCDGFDNNCDGRIDESYRVGESCTVGRGSCAASAQIVCSGDGRQAICPAKPQAPRPETCDGVDNNCDGAVDEGYAAHPTQCGVGACAATGMSQCVQGREQSSCQPRPAAQTDTTCDGVDDDCDGSADEDFIKLTEVCNGFDDDCDGRPDDGLVCSGGGTSGCVPKGTEICNGEDDDCDGKFDEDNVCGTTPTAGALNGAFWECADAACLTFANGGFMFLSNGQAMRLETFDHGSYDPASGPYCIEQQFQFVQGVGNSFHASFVDDKGLQQVATGVFTVNGGRATLDFQQGPADLLGRTQLVRVPEQAGGMCPRGPVCADKEMCGNGFDDDCDGQADAADSDCTHQCGPTSSTEVCDGIDNNCNGAIDDLSGNCERSDARGICRQGHLACSPVAGGQPICVAGTPESNELCLDGLDNDCDGQVDESGCVQPTPGEGCFNAIDVSLGGVFDVPEGARNDVQGACRPTEYNDRVFVLNTPAGSASIHYTIQVGGSDDLDVGASLYQVAGGYVPGVQCPALDPHTAMCIGRNYAMSQYLIGGGTYFVVVESSPYHKDPIKPGRVSLSVARLTNEGLCAPGDGDGDGTTICAGDCNDTIASIHPGALELCNQIDDDCDGIVDEQEGTCATGQPGVCAVGALHCGATPACQPIQKSARDFCGDGVDNDCNGAVDDNCVQAAGESCANAIDANNGGFFQGTLVGATDDAISRCGGDGAERFYRFTVANGGGFVRLATRGYRNGERYVLYRGCSLEVVNCNFYGEYLQAGDYRLAVEGDAYMAGQPYAFTLSISVADTATCLTPDLDGDGHFACQDDCDEGNPLVHAGAREPASCDGLDNDCSGAIDDVAIPCVVPGQQGVCADGRTRCEPSGTTFCEQTQYPEPRGRDICGDGLDNDCDGAADGQDAQGCVALPAGDTCSLAGQIDLSAGGVFEHTLAGYEDDPEFGCSSPISPSAERFYTIKINTRRTLQVQVQSPTDTGGTYYNLGVALLDSCDFKQSYPQCYGSGLSRELEPGTYILAVYGDVGRNYRLRIATHEPGDYMGTTCAPADLDGDGFTLCNGDCDERDRNANVNAYEVCDGIDNNCNLVVDEGLQYLDTPCTAAAPGECNKGALRCEQGAMRCVPAAATPELCADSRDNDCDGVVDEQGPGNCQVADAETCESAQPLPLDRLLDGSLVGAQNNGNGCYGGVNGMAAERYYRFDVPAPGYYFLQVAPRNASGVAYAAGITNGACGPSMTSDGCSSMGEQVVNYYLPNAGPHYVMVEADQPFDYRIRLATQPNGAPCSAPDQDADGFTLCNYDCDEQNAARHPGASERCNNLDDNCDGQVDEGC